MDPVPIVAALVLLAVLLAVRVPVAFALLASGTLGVAVAQGIPIATSVLGRVPFDTPSRYVLVIVPMFIAMGVLAGRSGVAEDAFALTSRITRPVPGGLGLAAVLGCAGFAAVSGSSVATLVTLGPVAIREMRRHGYDLVVAAGIVGSAGTLGVLIPPSVVLVVYGILTGESIGALLLAGIVPGVLTAIAYSVVLVVRAVRHPELMGGPASTEVPDAAVAVAADTRVRPTAIARIVVLFAIVVGGIYSGLATATEAAALGAAAALVFHLIDLRQEARGRRFAALRDALDEATRLSGMALALLIGGAVLAYLLVVVRVPASFAGWAADLAVTPIAVILVILAAMIVLGMFLDPLSILLIAVPIVYPAVTDLGFDGLWFGIVVVKVIEVGLVTPPLGINAYIVAGVTPDLSVGQAFRGILWFLPVDLAIIAVLFVFPGLVTWLPSVAAGT